MARYNKNPQYSRSGYAARLHASVLEPGDYKILLRIIRADNVSYFEHELTHKINVVNVRSNNIGRNLKYLDVFDNKYLSLSQSALSRAYIPNNCIASNNIEDSNNLIKSVSFKKGTAVIEGLNSQEKLFCDTFQSSIESIRIKKDGGKYIELNEVKGPGMIVLNDNYYPGWKAYDKISGDQLSIRPANLTFRSVILDKDKKYQVYFEYKPKWLTICYVLVSTSIILTLFLFIAAFRINRRRLL